MVSEYYSEAIASPNIAFIKYWGNRDDELRIPQNSSLSMNLDGLYTRTSVHFAEKYAQDELILNGNRVNGYALARVSQFLDVVRELAHQKIYVHVESSNNFAQGAGIASSASAFAALALAASKAIGLNLKEMDLSRLARRGSGSACRSVPSGFVEWQAGKNDKDSYAFSIADMQHWQIYDHIAIIDEKHKAIGSSQGHKSAASSPLQKCRVDDSVRRMNICRQAILEKNFAAFADIIELDSNMMHAVMMTSHPALFYWQPTTLLIIEKVKEWRMEGLNVSYTIDAGPNVHIICDIHSHQEIYERLKSISEIKQVLTATPGQGARLVNSH